MASTGIIQRRESKSYLINNPPLLGEIVYAIDTHEFGTLIDGVLIWKEFDDLVQSVSGKQGVITLDKNDVNLNNVDNTSDINKPISSAVQIALDTLDGSIAWGGITGGINTQIDLMNLFNEKSDKNTLSNVDNTSDINKPISTATSTVLNTKLGKFEKAQDSEKLDGLDSIDFAKSDNTFSKTEITAKLIDKADVSSVYNKSTVDTLLGNKASTSELNTALITKADITYVNTEISNLDTTIDTRFDSLESGNADKSYVDNQDTLLDNKITTNSGLIIGLDANKADISYVDSEISSINAASPGYVDTKYNSNLSKINTNIDNISTLESTKADKSYVDARDASQNQDITALETTIGTLPTTSEVTALANTAQTNANTYTDSKITPLNTRVTANESDITILQGQVGASPTNVYTKPETDTLLLAKAETIVVNSQIGEVQSDVDTNTASITNNFNTLNNKININSTSIANTETLTTTHTSQISTLNSNVSTAQSDISTAQSDIIENTSDINDLWIDKAEKTYVDSIVSGLDTKAACKVATISNVTLAGIQTIDGVSLSVNERVLVKNQTNKTQNGIYTIQSGAWIRSEDADNTPANEVSGGMYMFIIAGTVNQGAGFVMTYPRNNAILGTDNLIFEQFSDTTLNANEVLTKLKTVDGSGSGLDADLLDGQSSAYYRTATNLNAGTISDARLPATISSNITGTAAKATKLATARTIDITGDITATAVAFDGSSNITISASVNNNSHSHTTSTISALDGADITTGTISDARLPSSITSSITGTAAKATKLATARTITLGGDVSGSTTFDGSANKTISVVVNNDSHTHDGRYYTETESNNKYFPKAGGSVSGNVIIDNGVSTTLSVKGDDSGVALIRANGNSQGTGAVEVGQSDIHGGGIFYNGDSTPAFASGESSDKVSLYALSNGARKVVADWSNAGGVVDFKSTPSINNTSMDTKYAYKAGSSTQNFAVKDLTVSGALNGNATGVVDNSINSGAYVNGSIDRIHLAADIIDGTKIANDVINSEHYANNSIDALHLNVSGNGTTAQYLRSDGDGSMSWVTPPNTNTHRSISNSLTSTSSVISASSYAVKTLNDSIGDIAVALDTINGEVV